MQEEVIRLGRQYRQSFASIERFVLLQEQIKNSSAKKVAINIVDTTYIADGLLLLLAALPDFSEFYGKNVAIRYNMKNAQMASFLRDTGVLAYYDANVKEEQHIPKGIPFSKSNNVSDYAELVRKIMELAPVQFNSKAYSTMFSKLYEIFINASTHGKNELGTYTYGTLCNKNFIFTIYDAGVGIKENVNNFLKEDLKPEAAMKWALVGGNSTLITDYPRGAGFTLLESFATKNKGKITLCSDNVICIMENGIRKFHSMKSSIRGTLFIMNIKADSEYIYDM